MERTEIEKLAEKAELYIYQLMEAGREQTCAKNLIISERNADVIQYARKKLREAETLAGEMRDCLWRLYNQDGEIIKEEADFFEFMIQKLWGIKRNIRRKEKDLVNTANTKLAEFLQREISLKEVEYSIELGKLYSFLEKIAERV